MRISRVEITGFRRLAAAATNFDGPLTAFVGFNEAGKTSLLDALAWFTDGGAVSALDYNRSRPPASDATAIVKVYYELGDVDIASFAHVSMDNRPTTLTLSRQRDGNRYRDLKPSPARAARPFTLAQERLAGSRSNLARHFAAAVDEDADGPNEWADTVGAALGDPQGTWTQADTTALVELSAWLEATPEGRKQARDRKLAEMLRAIHTDMTEEHPSDLVWEALSPRRPEFVLFQQADRLLETTYELGPDQRASIHPAVTRLLSLSGISPDVMWAHIEAGDSTKRETLLERGNDRLQQVFNRAWNQSKVTVRLNVNGTRLEVLIKELDGGGDVTNISERSDGMRTFVALVAFLETAAHKVPPVLLIDEAETHLHYDAQADLVSVLLKSVDTTQVLYTTHSPGCLPSDLGTGVRVVARDADHADASVIKNNFWEGEGPGFSPLLFAMGAGAAAFSMCRSALLAEGASDMVLLPTLIRQATGLMDLDYQIAPGLANAHGSGLRVEEVAAKVVYLTDGDAGGKEHEQALKSAGVAPSRILRLPDGHAVEDLVHPDDYIATVNGFLEQMGQPQRFHAAGAPPGVPIAKAFADWAVANKIRTPGKVEVAYALIRVSRLRLTPTGKKALRELNGKLARAFAAVSAVP